MKNDYDELQRKIGAAQLKLEGTDADLQSLTNTLAPLEAKRDQLQGEMKYLRARIEKLTKMLAGA
jgi:chromosome segregation ATPase